MTAAISAQGIAAESIIVVFMSFFFLVQIPMTAPHTSATKGREARALSSSGVDIPQRKERPATAAAQMQAEAIARGVLISAV